MGIIQNAINQTLGTAGIAARLSPEYETKQQIYQINKQKSKIVEENKQLAKEESDIGKRIQSSVELGIPQKIAQANVELSELGAFSPKLAAESLRQAKKSSDIAQGLEDKKYTIKPFSIQEFRQQQALKKADSIQEAKASQKNRMSSYPKDLQKTLSILLKGRNITDG